MLKCKQCGHVSATVRFEGIIARGTGVLGLGDDGQVRAVGPVQISSCVKSGQEINHTTTLVCTNCEARGTIKSGFELVMRCVVTGAVDNVVMRAIEPMHEMRMTIDLPLREDVVFETLPALL